MREFILGTDWWTDCDDAVALRLLCRAHKAGEIRLKGIGLNGCMEYSVASMQGFLNWEQTGDIPQGIDLDAGDFGGNPPYQKGLAERTGCRRPNSDAENAVRLYRRLLSRSERKLEIIEIGYLQVMAAVLQSGPDEFSPLTGVELVREKVKIIWVMAGKWDENPGKENNFARNARSRAAGSVFCALCPVPVTFLGYEIGFGILTGGELKRTDVLYGVLCDHGSPDGRHSWDPMLVLAALIGDETAAGYTCVRGKASVDPVTGENWFEPQENGPHRYLVKAKDDAFYRDAVNERIQSGESHWMESL